jgi:hypothetical protein
MPTVLGGKLFDLEALFCAVGRALNRPILVQHVFEDIAAAFDRQPSFDVTNEVEHTDVSAATSYSTL